MGYTAVPFHAMDGNGLEIYHTNVMMALGESFVVICLETVQSEIEEEMLRKKFDETNKEIIEITLDQMMRFAGNMLQVRNDKGETFLVMSGQAFESPSIPTSFIRRYQPLRPMVAVVPDA